MINGHLIEDRDVELEKVRACGKTEVIEHYIVDRFSPPRPEDIITLPRGYWHGTNAHFFLWDEETGLGPDCFEAELVLRALDGRIAATLPIRVVRTDKPLAPPDGGAILLFTGEKSFAFTVVACLLTFFPRIADRTYPLAFLILIACRLE